MLNIQQGDYREHIQTQQPIKAIVTDPPYNTTGCSWDGQFNPEEFWQTITPLLAEQATVILSAQMRLAVELIRTSTIDFRHDLVWEKPNGTGQVRYSPNRCHELILVFGRGSPVYNAQLTSGKPYRWSSTRTRGEAVGYSGSGTINNTGTRHPRSVLKIKQERGLHPTQKPKELWEFLIRSYTKPDWKIIDPFAGSGTTAVVCDEIGRDYWVCEQDPDYIDIIKQRFG